MGVLGLLEPANPEPVLAAEVVHVDFTTVEDQAVRAVAEPWVSTRRPIVAVAANEVQLTIAVVTQGGQVEIFACVSSRRKAGVIDTTASVAVVLVRCTQVG